MQKGKEQILFYYSFFIGFKNNLFVLLVYLFCGKRIMTSKVKFWFRLKIKWLCCFHSQIFSCLEIVNLPFLNRKAIILAIWPAILVLKLSSYSTSVGKTHLKKKVEKKKNSQINFLQIPSKHLFKIVISIKVKTKSVFSIV